MRPSCTTGRRHLTLRRARPRENVLPGPVQHDRPGQRPHLHAFRHRLLFRHQRRACNAFIGARVVPDTGLCVLTMDASLTFLVLFQLLSAFSVLLNARFVYYIFVSTQAMATASSGSTAAVTRRRHATAAHHLSDVGIGVRPLAGDAAVRIRCDSVLGPVATDPDLRPGPGIKRLNSDLARHTGLRAETPAAGDAGIQDEELAVRCKDGLRREYDVGGCAGLDSDTL